MAREAPGRSQANHRRDEPRGNVNTLGQTAAGRYLEPFSSTGPDTKITKRYFRLDVSVFGSFLVPGDRIIDAGDHP
jgi:hypothetical protein